MLGGKRLDADIELAFDKGDCNGLAFKRCAHKLGCVKAGVGLPLGCSTRNGSDPFNAENILRIVRVVGVLPHVGGNKVEVLK